MAVPYIEAVNILRKIATERSKEFAKDAEAIPITSSVGRVCRDVYRSSTSTPSFDSSAMDGYAVNSEATLMASPEKPITFCVQEGTIAAGDPAPSVSATSSDGFISCVEIMTGAQFPVCCDAGKEGFFDACIKVEDTVVLTDPGSKLKLIQIQKPVRFGQNKRLAGSDFNDRDLIVGPGSIIKPNHVMALATLGTREIVVYRRLRIGVMSTGKELMSIYNPDECNGNQIRDSNGPYIEALLTELGVDVVKMGIVQDDVRDFTERITECLKETDFDVILTSGAVSMGKFDFVAAGLELLRADILFHKVAMRPGHPVLFANLPAQPWKITRHLTPPPPPTNSVPARTPFFGLPGNPLAAAVCLRFLVIPYLRALHGLQPGEGYRAAILTSTFESEGKVVKPLNHLQTYFHAKYFQELNQVELSKDQSSNKIRPLLDANCWVEIPAGGEEVKVGSDVKVYEMYPPIGR